MAVQCAHIPAGGATDTKNAHSLFTLEVGGKKGLALREEIGWVPFSGGQLET